ncbi:GNAT family N-acetyltransferase [uncultured Tenacibaculum sp.]|uniref:GNAT family N-acetyltransferase n=1 Tax=uncultured Tenacibaculum sp. TaxID=174713 RepID=UPI002609DA5D|nr:GNAT family N-acetyltransferase [uncultured Tenacibaculum sp.]
MIKIIETERLILRELMISDAEPFFNLNANSEVMRYTGDQPFSSISDAELFLKNYTDYKKNGFGRWAVILKESNEFVGWCGLKLNEEEFIDLGFRFFQKDWGKGYATEAAKASLKYGFKNLNLTNIIGRASIDNKASVRVLEKIGMIFWKNDSCKGIENSVYYKINKTQYNSL